MSRKLLLSLKQYFNQCKNHLSSTIHRELLPIIQKRDSQLLIIQFFNLSSGLLITTALICVWNLREQKERMIMVRSHLEYITQSISELDAKLNKIVEPYENYIKLLCTIPGVNRQSAITIISEIGTDMAQFSNSKRLCCWAGLTPGNNESAGKKKSVRISRAGVYLKPALVQVAHASVKSNKSPYFKIKYERIYKRRGKKRAIIAIARIILTAIYNMFISGEDFNPY